MFSGDACKFKSEKFEGYSLRFKTKVTFGHKLRYEIKVTFGEISLKLRQTNWNVVRNNVNVVVDELPSQITIYTCLIIDIWTRRRRRTSTRNCTLQCHPPKMAGFQWNWRQKFLTLLWTRLARRKCLVRTMQCMQFCAKSAKNDLKPTAFLKCNFILKQREYIAWVLGFYCTHPAKLIPGLILKVPVCMGRGCSGSILEIIGLSLLLLLSSSSFCRALLMVVLLLLSSLLLYKLLTPDAPAGMFEHNALACTAPTKPCSWVWLG